MKKTTILVMILVFITGCILGTVFNYMIQTNDWKILKSVLKGSLVGIISVVIYFIYMICYKRFQNDATNINTLNILAPLILWGSITKVISEYNTIQLNFWWIYIIIFVYSILVICISNHIVRKYTKKPL